MRHLNQHHYVVNTRWTGNSGTGTSAYRAYSRNHEIDADGKPMIAGSSDPHFRGDRTRWNPEELLVAALSSCHQLSYLHLCADAGVIVTAYEDAAQGVMVESSDGGGQFTSVTLHPKVTIRAGSNAELAISLHKKAHALCFIARSVGFNVEAQPSVVVEGDR